MQVDLQELEEKISKNLPDALRYAFLRTYKEHIYKGDSDMLASLRAWWIVEKIRCTKKSGDTGIYSSVKPTPHTADLIEQYIKDNNIPNPVPKDKLHSTVVYSREPFAGYVPKEDMTIVRPFDKDEFGNPGGYSIRKLGKDKEAIVLCFYSCDLEKQFWQALNLGASWDHVGHVLHVTLSYNAADYDITQLKVPEFEMAFEPEKIEAFQDDWVEENVSKFSVMAPISKVDEDKRIVYGWASVIQKDGQDVTDLQGDIIDSEEEIVEAAHDFMTNYREGHEMHSGVSKGRVVESVVFTKALQQALGIDLKKVGWLIGYQVDDDAAWAKVKKGEYTAFSIGGRAVREPVNEEK